MEAMDGDFNERMRAALRTAEVLSVFFVRVGRSLILDTRRGGAEGPTIVIDQIAASPQARLASFRRLRPELPLPESLTLAPWSGAVREFEAAGLLGTMLERSALEGGRALQAATEQAFNRLVKLERQALREMVRGIGMQTIWQRSDG